jgi:hypothetical protein
VPSRGVEPLAVSFGLATGARLGGPCNGSSVGNISSQWGQFEQRDSLTAGPTPSAQTARMKGVMRAKLDHSQRILEAVVTSNWQLLDRDSRDMAQVVRDPAWTSLAMPEYVRHSEAFLRATNELAEAVRLRDLESASLGLISLTTSCVSCHRYLARARIVRVP